MGVGYPQQEAFMTREFKGYNGTFILTDTGVTIKRGVKGFLFGGGHLRGDKTIPYSSIVAVQLKKAGLTAGYIQLTLKGGSEAKGGLLESTKDENTIHYYSKSNKDFEECKALIEERLGDNGHKSYSSFDELEKLAELRDKGILTSAEFEAKKRQMLNL